MGLLDPAYLSHLTNTERSFALYYSTPRLLFAKSLRERKQLVSSLAKHRPGLQGNGHKGQGLACREHFTRNSLRSQMQISIQVEGEWQKRPRLTQYLYRDGWSLTCFTSHLRTTLLKIAVSVHGTLEASQGYPHEWSVDPNDHSSLFA